MVKVEKGKNIATGEVPEEGGENDAADSENKEEGELFEDDNDFGCTNGIGAVNKLFSQPSDEAIQYNLNSNRPDGTILNVEKLEQSLPSTGMSTIEQKYQMLMF